jgi:hypothetical protein
MHGAMGLAPWDVDGLSPPAVMKISHTNNILVHPGSR